MRSWGYYLVDDRVIIVDIVRYSPVHQRAKGRKKEGFRRCKVSFIGKTSGYYCGHKKVFTDGAHRGAIRKEKEGFRSELLRESL